MTEQELPHGDYIAAVVDALTAADCVPTQWEVLTPHDGIALEAILEFWPDHPRLIPDPLTGLPSRVIVGWGVEGWSWQADYGTSLMPFTVDSLAEPDAVGQAIQEVLATGIELDHTSAPQWEHAAETQSAIDAWYAEAED
jgi:hypothetical protein